MYIHYRSPTVAFAPVVHLGKNECMNFVKPELIVLIGWFQVSNTKFNLYLLANLSSYRDSVTSLESAKNGIIG